MEGGVALLDAYKILALPRDASDDEIRRAYHRLAREHHPDRSTAASAADFDRVQQAWEALREPAARQQHDARLRDAELLEAGARGRVEDVDLSDMEEEAAATGGTLWRRDCRCGDEFVATADDVDAGRVIACCSCSLAIRPRRRAPPAADALAIEAG
jgi:diphthamide biosynthesis protein 4